MKRNANVRTVILIALGVAYLLLGAGVFSKIERQKEKETKEILEKEETQIK